MTTSTNTHVTMLDQDNMIIDGVNVRLGMPVSYNISSRGGFIVMGSGFIQWGKSFDGVFEIYKKGPGYDKIWIVEEYCVFSEKNGKVHIKIMV
jgi:hypothetical protein